MEEHMAMSGLKMSGVCAAFGIRRSLRPTIARASATWWYQVDIIALITSVALNETWRAASPPWSRHSGENSRALRY